RGARGRRAVARVAGSRARQPHLVPRAHCGRSRSHPLVRGGRAGQGALFARARRGVLRYMTGGGVVWITGLPSAGKWTFAERWRNLLGAQGMVAPLLDGDAVRECLEPRLGYSAEARADFYGTLANLAALLARQGLVVIVAATANRRVFRERARALAPAFLE